MAIITGVQGKVSIDAVEVAGVTQFTLNNEKILLEAEPTLGGTQGSFIETATSSKKWSGSFDVLYDSTVFETLYAAYLSNATVTLELIPKEGTGLVVFSGNAHVTSAPVTVSAGAIVKCTCNFSGNGDLTMAPNIVLSTQDFGSTGQGDASAYTAPTASGGTATYTIEMEDENGDASALPYGISWSGSAFTGTVNAAAPLGIYRVKVKVTDSASPPVVKYFLATMEVVA